MAFRILPKQPAVKLNCWEFKKCGREPGGAKVAELGVCPAARDETFHGIFGGRNSGRACWVVAGTFCKGEVQGTFAQKFKNCSNCDFYKQVQAEESPHNYPVTVLLTYLNQTHEKRVEERTHELIRAKEDITRAVGELEKVNELLSETNQELEFTQKIANADMKMAARIQSSFFPRHAPKNASWDIAFTFKPLSGVSGDLYDFYTSGRHLLGASLFDVSGHGIASGLITLLARSIIFRRFMEGGAEKLSRVMELINHDLIAEMENVDNYLTGILLRFDDDKIEYVNAGHTDLLVKLGTSGKVVTVEPKDREFKGGFLGVAAMESKYSTVVFKIAKNDLVLLYSDCLIESENREGEKYGVERLSKSLENLRPGMSAAEILDQVVCSFMDFVGTDNIRDDLTIMLIRKK